MIRLSRFLQPYSWSIAAILVLLLFNVLANLYLPTVTADIVDVGVLTGNVDYILRHGAVMLVVAVGGMICSISASFLSSKTATAFGRIIREQVFTRVESFSLHEFDMFGTATLITRTTNDVTQVQQVTVMILRMMLMAPLTILGGLILAFSKDNVLTLVLLVAIPIVLVIIGITLWFAVPLFGLMQAKIDRLNLVLREGLTGIRVVRAFDRVAHEERRFAEANADLTANAIKVNRLMALTMPCIILVMNLTTVAVVWFGAGRINTGQMHGVGDLLAFTQYAVQILFSVLLISMMFVMIPRGAASATRINAVLDTQPEILDPEHPTIVASQAGYLDFKNVTFRYPGAEESALSNITFQARPGEVTAIIGGTGSGKSTLINLIPRFYDIESGEILIDGVDIRSMTQEALRTKIGLAPQKTVLFSGTVADNITYGKPGASEADIAHAATVAQAVEFIDAMPDGYNGLISQGGTNVSGGQKQRLSIARVIARRPEIYIFDDSFSALDFKTDAQLRSALRAVTTASTVLIVAQRVATVMDADRILVLDEGRLVGNGTHRQLLTTSAVYREIVASQLSAEEIA